MTEQPKYELNPLPFYHNEGGLCFSCKPQCAACCKMPGRVEITEMEAERMAAHLGEHVEKFRKRYVRNHNDPLLLKERSDGSCVFLDKKDKCMVYPVRPAQCRTYPFWDEVLANDFTWLLEKGVCPGIDQGKLYHANEIDAVRKNNGEVAGY